MRPGGLAAVAVLTPASTSAGALCVAAVVDQTRRAVLLVLVLLLAASATTNLATTAVPTAQLTAVALRMPAADAQRSAGVAHLARPVVADAFAAATIAADVALRRTDLEALPRLLVALLARPAGGLALAVLTGFADPAGPAGASAAIIIADLPYAVGYALDARPFVTGQSAAAAALAARFAFISADRLAGIDVASLAVAAAPGALTVGAVLARLAGAGARAFLTSLAVAAGRDTLPVLADLAVGAVRDADAVFARVAVSALAANDLLAAVVGLLAADGLAARRLPVVRLAGLAFALLADADGLTVVIAVGVNGLRAVLVGLALPRTDVGRWTLVLLALAVAAVEPVAAGIPRTAVVRILADALAILAAGTTAWAFATVVLNLAAILEGTALPADVLTGLLFAVTGAARLVGVAVVRLAHAEVLTAVAVELVLIVPALARRTDADRVAIGTVVPGRAVAPLELLVLVGVAYVQL